MVGAKKQSFSVHKDLLTLYSGYFREKLRDGKDDAQVLLAEMSPPEFAVFVSWLYSGSLDLGLYALDEQIIRLGPRQWQWGYYLQAPEFQNSWMDVFRALGDCYPVIWPDLAFTRATYNINPQGSKLRQFVADSIASYSPFRVHPPDSPEYAAWEKLLQENGDLSIDILRAGATHWEGALPWDYEHRHVYMEEEFSLAQLWEEQILASRSIDDIRKAVENKCFRSKLELVHLERKTTNSS